MRTNENNTVKMLRYALESGQQVPVHLQERALAAFKENTKANSALAQSLLKCNGLDDAISREVCKLGGAEEIAIWLTLPGRTSDEVVALLKKEKRVKVLSSIVDRDDLPVEVFETLIKATKNAELLAKVVANESVPNNIKMLAVAKGLKSLDTSSYGETWATSGKMRALVNVMSAEIRATAFDGVTNFKILKDLFSILGEDTPMSVSDRMKAALLPVLSDPMLPGNLVHRNSAKSFVENKVSGWETLESLTVLASADRFSDEEVTNLRAELDLLSERIAEEVAANPPQGHRYSRGALGVSNEQIAALLAVLDKNGLEVALPEHLSVQDVVGALQEAARNHGADGRIRLLQISKAALQHPNLSNEALCEIAGSVPNLAEIATQRSLQLFGELAAVEVALSTYGSDAFSYLVANCNNPLEVCTAGFDHITSRRIVFHVATKSERVQLGDLVKAIPVDVLFALQSDYWIVSNEEAAKALSDQIFAEVVNASSELSEETWQIFATLIADGGISIADALGAGIALS